MECALFSVLPYIARFGRKYLSLGASVFCNRTALSIDGFNSRTKLTAFPFYGMKQGFQSLDRGLDSYFASAVVYYVSRGSQSGNIHFEILGGADDI